MTKRKKKRNRILKVSEDANRHPPRNDDWTVEIRRKLGK
jgi:hypothetical protein